VNYPHVIHGVSDRLRGMWKMWSHPPGPGHTFVVTCSIIITHILYALSGRRGFLSMELDGKINA